MREYEIKQVDSFTDMAFGGNPAGVVPDAEGLSDKEMQNIASEMNLSETAFILPSKEADFRLRWFTPKKEIIFCGHATIASLHILAENKKFGMEEDGTFNFKIETLVGILDVQVDKLNDSIKITLQAPEIDLVIEKLDIEKLSEALDIDLNDIDISYPIMREKTIDFVYIVLKELLTLKRVNYNYDKLEDLSNAYGIKGFVLFTTETFEEDSMVHSRFFSPFYGVREDPVTGSAQGPLGTYMVLNKMVNLSNGEAEIKSEQGDIMGRPGRLIVKVIENEGLYISRLIGEAVTVIEGKILLK